MEKGEKKQDLTAEQIKEIQTNALVYYKEQIEFLKPRYEYEKLLADIEEVNFKRLKYSIETANILSQMKKSEEEANKQQPEKREHKLKIVKD